MEIEYLNKEGVQALWERMKILCSSIKEINNSLKVIGNLDANGSITAGGNITAYYKLVVRNRDILAELDALDAKIGTENAGLIAEMQGNITSLENNISTINRKLQGVGNNLLEQMRIIASTVEEIINPLRVIGYLNVDGNLSAYGSITTYHDLIAHGRNILNELDALSERIGSLANKIGSFEGTVAGVYNRGEYNKQELQNQIAAQAVTIAALTERIATLEASEGAGSGSGGSGGSEVNPNKFGSVGTNNKIEVVEAEVGSSYALRYVDGNDVLVPNITDIISD